MSPHQTEVKHEVQLEPTRDGLLVRLAGVDVGNWLSTSDQSAIQVGSFVRLYGDGQATPVSTDALLIPWDGIASLSWEEIRQSRMPDPSPLELEVESRGPIVHPDFTLEYQYMQRGRRVLVQRQGAWLTVGDGCFTLLDPMYSVVQALDQYDSCTMTDIEERMKWWGQVSKLFPKEVVMDDYLRSLHVVVAATFRIEPFQDSAGDPNFDPIPVVHVGYGDEPDDGEPRFVDLLDDEKQTSFRRYFREYEQVRQRYPVGGGTYIFFTEQLVRALDVVRHSQKGTAEERRAFLKEPHSYLRSALVGAESNDEATVDDVFCDHGLSERVHRIGIWTGKELPWLPKPGQPWLPPEELGVVVDGTSLPITVDELPALLDRLTAAARAAVPAIDVGGVRVRVTEEAIATVRLLITQRQVMRPSTTESRTPASVDRVLLVIDNLEDLAYLRRRKPRGPEQSDHRPELNSELLAHQYDGVRWLHRRWNSGSWGALLADDMGLGKTLQAMAFLLGIRALMRSGRIEHQPILVVAPTGLLQNWEDEHSKHLADPGLGKVVRGYGKWLRHLRSTPSSGKELASGRPVLDIAKLRRAAWVVTTYETLRDFQHSFARVRWCVGVFDEAQKIKNPNTKMTEAALAMNIDFALLMTGTPVENRPADIWSILDRCEPGVFGPLKEFSRKYERDDASGQALQSLHRRLTSSPNQVAAPSVMLRRLKEDHISELPSKEVCRLPMEMPAMQAAAYAAVVYNRRLGVPPLTTLNQLRSISLHPGTPDPSREVDDYIAQSARLLSTFRVLEQVRDRREKALVFIEARQMQTFLIGALRRKFSITEDVMVVNGAVSGQARKARVDRFQQRSGFDVMLLSPKAGGVGLTLTAANHVIHLSRWWNPAVEDQCTDRTYRIGQRNSVRVYLPLARHPGFGDYSFDVKLDELMERKRAMNRSVLAPVSVSEHDVNHLLTDTITEASRRAPVRKDAAARGIRERPGASNGDSAASSSERTNPESIPREDVSIMEPEQFEIWVLEILREVGYDAQPTPRAGDRGADGIARSKDGRQTLVVQCKHTQGQRPCGATAVREVWAAVNAYDLQGDVLPVVVTNARGFSKDARKVAERHRVRLVNARDRSGFRRALSALD